MEAFKELVNHATGPTTFFIVSVLVVVLGLVFVKQVTRPLFGLGMLAGSIAFVAIAATDPNFASIISKPDNVPILMLLGSVGFFTWYSLRRGVVNDGRRDRGDDLLEVAAGKADKSTFVWPDLVYTELIAMVVGSVLLIVWSIFLKAPLEPPANPTKAPNPSKAPWYFLGLQEMLVYYDPWIAGVLLPTFIIVGLMALPYIDVNPRGNGYFTFKERKFAISMFLFGFIVLWTLLILLGTFLRGPNWNFFGPFEFWDPHKVEPLVNVNLSEIIWVKFLGTRLPTNPLVRESFGFVAVILYLVALPPLFAKTLFKRYFVEMGFVRYNILMNLFLMMMSLPVKMFLRWAFNLKYIVAIPEVFFNI